MKRTEKDFETKHFPTWCPGCGDFGIWGALKQSLVQLGHGPDDVVVVYGIGCSGNMTNFLDVYGFHGLHGRPIPVATGIKIANHKLPVIVVAGDGDTFGEGANHFLHAARANIDITVLVHDNHIYGLTTGQTSPTSKQGTVTKTTPSGSVEHPLNPLALALTAGATFVARGFAGDIPHLTSLIKQAVRHPGFSFIDVLQPCVTFNPDYSYQYYRDRVKKIDSKTAVLNTRAKALAKAMQTSSLPIGVFFQEKKPAHHQMLPQLKDQPLVTKKTKKRNISKLMQSLT